MTREMTDAAVLAELGARPMSNTGTNVETEAPTNQSSSRVESGCEVPPPQ